MEQRMLLAALGLALIVSVGGLLTPSRTRQEGDARVTTTRLTPAEWLALALPLLGFLVTLPTHPPLFAAGQGLGRGFLLGGIGALLLYFAARRTRMDAAHSAVIALPIASVAIPLLYLRPVLLDALMGVAIGWFAVAFPLCRQRITDEEKGTAAPMIAAAGFAAALAATALMGNLRDPRTPDLMKGTWGALALAFASGGALFAWIVELLRRSGGKAASAMGTVAAVGLSLVLALLLATKAAAEMRLFAILAIGILLWLLIGWLIAASRAGESGAERIASRFGGGLPFLSILLAVSGFMVGGQLMQGYGSGLILVAFYVVWAATSRSGDGEVGLRYLLFTTVLVLYRAYLARWSDDLHGVNLSDQYALFGLVVGAAAPGLMGGVIDAVRWGRRTGARPIAESVVAGLLALAIPGCVELLFGPKCALGLLLGAGLGAVFSPIASATPTETRLSNDRQSIEWLLFAIGMALALDQWSDRVMPYDDIARIVKLKALAVVLALLLVGIAIATWGRSSNAPADKRTEGELL